MDPQNLDFLGHLFLNLQQLWNSLLNLDHNSFGFGFTK